jgi:ribonuclease P protein component
MLKKENRLTTNFEYKITQKYGKHFIGKYFHLYILEPKSYEGQAKVGIVVSNKLHNKAAKRNYVKRLYRESVQKHIDKIKDRHLWIAIYPKFDALGKKYEEIRSDFNKTVQKTPFF